jgi:hypothetical protein
VRAIVLAISQQVPSSSEGVLVGLHRTIPPVTRHSEWVPTGRLDSGHMTHPRLPEPCLNVLDRMVSRVRGNVVGELAKRSLAMRKLLMHAVAERDTGAEHPRFPAANNPWLSDPMLLKMATWWVVTTHGGCGDFTGDVMSEFNSLVRDLRQDSVWDEPRSSWAGA